MNASGDAAEQIVRMSLEGVQAVAKITGDGAERLAKILLLAVKDTGKSKGRASLSKLLKSNKPIKVFEIKDSDLKKFCQEAKKYGVLYHVLKDKDKNDGKCDIMVRAEDASKVNRIFERFHLGANNKAVIRKAVEKSQVPKEKEKTADDQFIDELFGKPKQKEKTGNENPSAAKTGTSRPSEPTFGRRNDRRESQSFDEMKQRPSVKAQLNSIRMEQQKAKIKTPIKKNTKKKGVKAHDKI